MPAIKHLLLYILIPYSTVAFSNLGHDARSFKVAPQQAKLNQMHYFGVTTAGKYLSVVARSSADDDQEETAPMRANIWTRFLTNFWYSLTIPFTDLRKLIPKADRDANSFALSLRLKEGFIAIAAYLAIGVFAYHKIFEKWSIVDSLYFTCVVFSTVGYGDMCPQTVGGKIFTCLFGFTGIALLGAAIASIGSKLIQVETEAAKRAKTASQKSFLKMFDKMPKLKKADKNEKKRIVKDIVANNHQQLHLPKAATAVLNGVRWVAQSGLVVILAGMLLGKVEGWKMTDSVYYALITASTIGLGDFAPATKAGRLLALLLIPMTVAAFGEILSNIGLALIARRQKKLFDGQLETGLTMAHLKIMDNNNDGKVDREEYVLFMLLEMGLVSKDEVEELTEQFDRLDRTRSGYLNQDDILLIASLRENHEC
ncbi:MAG: hypothetical protein SGBAC_010102 [Bacillariaceae sp.]